MGRKFWKYYRTRDGKADYRFSWEEQKDGTWRIYIDDQPSYGNRAPDNHSTHRHSAEEEGDERKYVCWSSPLYRLGKAMQVSAVWADNTQEYIKSGKKF